LSLINRRLTTKGEYMKKSILTLTAVTLASIAAPAMAGSVTGEVRFADVREGNPDSTEYKVEYSDSLNSFLNFGGELQVKQRENHGSVDSKISVKLGPKTPDVLGFSTATYGEVGRALKAGTDTDFWGAGVKVSRPLIGPVSVNAGYRHRQGFQSADLLNEERLNAGLSLKVSSKVAVGTTYYRTRGTSDSDAIGINITRSF
jgi:opacity protein-like surface antigen